MKNKKTIEKTSDKGGFTLVEIIVAVAILALMFSLALPEIFAHMPEFRINRVSSELKAQIRLARMKAMSEGVPAQVTFDNAEDEYSIWSDLDQNGATNDNELSTFDIEDSPGVGLHAYNGLTGRFKSDGFFEVDGSSLDLVWVRVNNPDIARYDFVVIWPSGQVSVYEYN